MARAAELAANLASRLAAERAAPERWPVFVALTNGRVYGCDFVVSATGVDPNVPRIVCAAGVAESAEVDSVGALVVDEELCLSVRSRGADGSTTLRPCPYAFAAGDCSAVRLADTMGVERGASNWFQMRLWSQARSMGELAAFSMRGALGEVLGGFCFELFQHATRFFGKRVVLLGRFNGAGLAHMDDVTANVVVTSTGVVQRRAARALLRHAGGAAVVRTATAAAAEMDSRGESCPKRVRPSRRGRGATPPPPPPTARPIGSPAPPCTAPAADASAVGTSETTQVLVRCTPGREYIKAVLHQGRMVGAMLVGATELEETFLNLILNQLDISALADNLLTDCVDIEDYFD